MIIKCEFWAFGNECEIKDIKKQCSATCTNTKSTKCCYLCTEYCDDIKIFDPLIVEVSRKSVREQVKKEKKDGNKRII